MANHIVVLPRCGYPGCRICYKPGEAVAVKDLRDSTLKRLEEQSKVFHGEEAGLKADITGLMAKAKPGWEERVARLAKPENFTIELWPSLVLDCQLSDSELERLHRKLKLVRQAALYMAAGMLKGTLKYDSDDYSLEQWFAHLLGEGADQMNYQLLLADAFERRK